MCEPTTIMAGVGLGMQLIGGMSSARAAEQAGEYEAAIALQNAAVATQQADEVRRIGHEQEEAYLKDVASLTGTQRATFAANNVDPSSGSAAQILQQTAGEGAADAARIRANAFRQAWGYDVEAVNQRNRAAFAQYSGKAQRQAGMLSTGANTFGSGYSMFKGGLRPKGASGGGFTGNHALSNNQMRIG